MVQKKVTEVFVYVIPIIANPLEDHLLRKKYIEHEKNPVAPNVVKERTCFLPSGAYGAPQSYE